MKNRVCGVKDLHTVKKRVDYDPPKCILPLEIVKKYKNMKMEFWKNRKLIEYD